MSSTLFRAGVLGPLAFLSFGCATTSHSSAIHVIPVPRGLNTVTRYGIVHEVPRAPKLKYVSAEGTHAFYEAPFEIAYSWPRANSVANAGFSLFLPTNRIRDAAHPLTSDVADSFVRAERDPTPHVVESVRVEPDNRFGRECFRFNIRKRRTNPGDLGSITTEEGFLFPHPFDSKRIVVVLFFDEFDPAQGMAPDPILRDIAEEWFRSIRIEAPSEEENAYMGRRDWKWVPLNGKIPE